MFKGVCKIGCEVDTCLEDYGGIFRLNMVIGSLWRGVWGDERGEVGSGDTVDQCRLSL
jgi:hypothetical protein